MKKLIFVLMSVILMGSASFAQNKEAKVKQNKKETTAATASTPADAPVQQRVKKDGTPDMRYKANQDAAKAAPAGPTKKDGTPDRRYKANKDAAAPAQK